MKRPRAILFDHDGVLVTSEHLHAIAWKELLKQLGIPYQDEQFRDLIGRTAPQILKILLDESKPGWRAEDYDLDALALQKNDIYLKVAETELGLYPGVREGLEWMKSVGMKAGVVSNAKRRELDHSLVHLGVKDFFEVVLSRDDVPRPKPDPEAYWTGARLIGEDVTDCMAIEDSPTGLAAALRSGIASVAVTSNYPREKLVSIVPENPGLTPLWIVESMVEFFEKVRALEI